MHFSNDLHRLIRWILNTFFATSEKRSLILQRELSFTFWSIFTMWSIWCTSALQTWFLQSVLNLAVENWRANIHSADERDDLSDVVDKATDSGSSFGLNRWSSLWEAHRLQMQCSLTEVHGIHVTLHCFAAVHQLNESRSFAFHVIRNKCLFIMWGHLGEFFTSFPIGLQMYHGGHRINDVCDSNKMFSTRFSCGIICYVIIAFYSWRTYKCSVWSLMVRFCQIWRTVCDE